MAKLRPATRPSFEALETRLALSTAAIGVHDLVAQPIPAGTVSAEATHPSPQRFPVGYRFVQPLSTLKVDGTFNPNAPTVVLFRSASGFRMEVPPDSVSAAQVSVAVPFSVNPRTGQFNTHGYTVWVVQTTPAGTVRTPAVYHLQIEQPSVTGLPPGTVVNAFLTGEQSVLGDEVAKLQSLAARSGGTLNVAPLVSELTTEKQVLGQEQQLFQALMSGRVSSLDVGRFRGRPVTLTLRSLGAMDRIIAAAFSGAGGAVTVAPLPTGASAPASVRAEEDSSSGVLGTMQSYFTNLQNLHYQTPTAGELEEAEQVSQTLGYASKAMGLVLIALGGEVAVPVAAGLGVATWAYTTIRPFYTTDVALETTLNDAESGETTPASETQIGRFLGKALVDLALDRAFDLNAEALIESIVTSAEAGVMPSLLATDLTIGKDIVTNVASDIVPIEVGTPGAPLGDTYEATVAAQGVDPEGNTSTQSLTIEFSILEYFPQLVSGGAQIFSLGGGLRVAGFFGKDVVGDLRGTYDPATHRIAILVDIGNSDYIINLTGTATKSAVEVDSFSIETNPNEPGYYASASGFTIPALT